MEAAPPVPVGATELVDIGGRSLNVWRAGQGAPTVVLVHGIPTNHLLWHDVVPHLQSRASVLAIDMLGYGWSDRPQGWRVDIAAQASYVLRVLEVLGIERFAYVGHDLGGGVGQILAVVTGTRVEALTIIDGVAFDGWPVPAAKALKATRRMLAHMPAPALATGLQRGLRTLFAQPDRARQFTPRFAAAWRGPQSPAVLATHLRHLDPIYTETVAPFLPHLRMPVEVLWSRQDSQMKPRYARMLTEAIPDAHLEWVDEAAHFVPADAPQAVIDAVVRSLSRGARLRAST